MEEAHLKVFSTVLDEFLQNLSNRFPRNTVITATKVAISSMNYFTPGETCRQFLKYTLPYEKMINEKDYTHLIKITNEEKKNHIGYIHDCINNVLNLWSTTDDETKEVIFEYIQILLRFGKLHFEVNNLQI